MRRLSLALTVVVCSPVTVDRCVTDADCPTSSTCNLQTKRCVLDLPLDPVIPDAAADANADVDVVVDMVVNVDADESESESESEAEAEAESESESEAESEPDPEPLPLGSACTEASECSSSFCISHLCCESDCQGSDTACAGTCSSAGFCEYPGPSTLCGLCAACDGLGGCLATPTDDPNCGGIDCDGLDSTCRDYADLQASRCAAYGTCVDENDPTTCLDYTDATAGADCGLCATCNGVGSCSLTPADDAACGTINCAEDTICRDVEPDLISARCEGLQNCKEASDCSFTNLAIGTNCGLCAQCDGSGGCTQVPEDDSRCGIIECDALDTICRNYSDMTVARCKTLGDCKEANSADCSVYSNVADGSLCATGTCLTASTQLNPDVCVAGFCVDGGTRACDPFICSGTNCLTTCTSSAQCTTGNSCPAGHCCESTWFAGTAYSSSSTAGSPNHIAVSTGGTIRLGYLNATGPRIEYLTDSGPDYGDPSSRGTLTESFSTSLQDFGFALTPIGGWVAHTYRSGTSLYYDTNGSGAASLIESGPSGVGSGYGDWSTLAIGSDSTVHVIYTGTNTSSLSRYSLRYAYKESGDTDFTVCGAISTSSFGSSFEQPRIAVYASGLAVVASLDAYLGNIHLEFQTSGCTFGASIPVGTASDELGPFDLAVSSDGLAHVAYRNATQSQLRHAACESSCLPDDDEVIATNEADTAPAIAIDDADQLFILYQNTSNNIQLAHNALGYWTTWTAANESDALGESLDMVLAADGRIHTSFYNITATDPWYATLPGECVP